MTPGYYWAQFKDIDQLMVGFWTGQHFLFPGSETPRSLSEVLVGPRIKPSANLRLSNLKDAQEACDA